jgi:hypothetical protein
MKFWEMMSGNSFSVMGMRFSEGSDIHAIGESPVLLFVFFSIQGNEKDLLF